MENVKEIIELMKFSSKQDIDLITRAFNFAQSNHQDQKRFSGEPYFIHCIRTAKTLAGLGMGSAVISAGLLHDSLEDGKIEEKELKKEFGEDISFLVEGVSKLGKLRYSKKEANVKPIEKRLEEPIDVRAENLRKMFFAMAEDLRIIFIKLADRLDNMKTLNYLPLEKQKRIALETMEIFAPLANRLGMGDMKGQLEDLAFPYLYPNEFEWLIKSVKERYEKREKYLEKVRPVLIEILEKEKIEPINVHSRAKHYWTLYQKLLKYEKNFEEIYDMVALRVIVKDIKTCYETLGILHKFWRPLPGRIKDYIAFPKPNGYRALHTTLFCLEGKITEIQIKTLEMHEEAEYGICAHWAHKEGVDPKLQEKKFAWVKQLKDWQKEISKSGEFLKGLKIDFFKNRIFVLTPKGDVIDLPDGACPIDFAYSIHSEIGDRITGAKVNGKLVSLETKLVNGDIVEILTKKEGRPHRKWLECVKTTTAKKQIRAALQKIS